MRRLERDRTACAATCWEPRTCWKKNPAERKARAMDEDRAEEVLDVLKHALGWPGCYRNMFVAEKGHRSWAALEEARSAMLMTRTVRPHIPGFIYQVTATGR